jgi:glycosyltransferase involved in cell wall biosynthesis
VSRPRVAVLRGPQANPWELRAWEPLQDDFDVRVVVPDESLYDLSGLGLRQVRARAWSDWVPTAAGTRLAARLPFNRHVGLAGELAGTDVVHAAELSFWFSAQAAALKAKCGFRLVLTVWETIPFRAAGRNPLARPNRRRVLAATDLFLATTERARAALLLEGAPADRIEVAPPGIDLERFGSAAGTGAAAPGPPVVISPGRLVWEKGHQDVIRAIAALRGGLVDAPPAARDVRLLVVGSGPERDALRRYADDLGLGDAVQLREHVPYDEMPVLYARATAMVLASLPIRRWEEQFGMVLAEAMAAGLPIVTTTSGAIPEVVGDEAALVPPGDWMGFARALAAGPLANPGARAAYSPERVRRFGTQAAADRLAAAYRRVLGAQPALSAATA